MKKKHRRTPASYTYSTPYYAHTGTVVFVFVFGILHRLMTSPSPPPTSAPTISAYGRHTTEPIPGRAPDMHWMKL